MLTFGEKLRRLRIEAGLSCECLAERAGLCHMSVYNYERGRHGPSPLAMQRLAAALGVSMGEFDNCDFPSDHRERRGRK